MRSIMVTMWITLDGVVQGLGRPDEDTRGGFTHGGWGQRYNDEVMGREMAKAMTRPGEMLFGRRTWQDFITAWGRRPDRPLHPAHPPADPGHRHPTVRGPRPTDRVRPDRQRHDHKGCDHRPLHPPLSGDRRISGHAAGQPQQIMPPSRGPDTRCWRDDSGQGAAGLAGPCQPFAEPDQQQTSAEDEAGSHHEDQGLGGSRQHRHGRQTKWLWQAELDRDEPSHVRPQQGVHPRSDGTVDPADRGQGEGQHDRGSCAGDSVGEFR